jgi:hypothetical protein
MITLEETNQTIENIIDEEARKGASTQCFTVGEYVWCFLYYTTHHKRVMVFSTAHGRTTRVLDTDNTQTGVLLDSMMSLPDFQEWVSDEARVEEFVETYLQDHDGDLGVLLYAVVSWAVSTDTSTLSDIPLGVTGIAQLNERAGSALVTGLVKAVTSRG